MNKISKTIAIALMLFLASPTFSIKLTNNTNDNLLYCCGNPANKIIVLQKHELPPRATTEISESEDYLQIYTKNQPQKLAGKFALNGQNEDLTIIKHLNPMFGYVFKTSSELTQPESRRTPPVGAVPLFDISNSKSQMNEDSISTRVKNDLTLSEILKKRAQHKKGRRLPSRKRRDPISQESASQPSQSTGSYFTKKGLVIALGTLGTVYLVIWWLSKQKPQNH